MEEEVRPFKMRKTNNFIYSYILSGRYMTGCTEILVTNSFSMKFNVKWLANINKFKMIMHKVILF